MRTGDTYALQLISDALDLSQVFSMQLTSVCTDWLGRELKNPFRYALGRDERNLVYLCEAPYPPPGVAPGLNFGRYLANLAEPETKSDTAELFLMLSGGSYLEIHLNYEGAWWYMEFSGYRTRIPTKIPQGIKVTIRSQGDSWLGAISLPIDQLPISFGASLRYQATLAVCSGTEPVYITSGGTPDFEPDFHDSRVFLEITL